MEDQLQLKDESTSEQIITTQNSTQNTDSAISLQLTKVNCAKRADVTFLVGEENPQPVYAHIIVLEMHSEVFKTMFSGDFAALKEIPITDMEPDVFLEMLKFIYAGAAGMTLTTSNMIGLLYGAQKYMLPNLKAICEDFILAHTDVTNVLEVFDASQFFENDVVQDACFRILLDNPILFFKDEKFNDLSLAAVKSLVQQPAFNCSGKELQLAVLNWQKHQTSIKGMTDADAFKILKREAGIKKERFYGHKFLNMQVNSFEKYSMTNFQTADTICNLNPGDAVPKCLYPYTSSATPPNDLQMFCTICGRLECPATLPVYGIEDGSKFVYGIGIYTGGNDIDTTEEVTITLSDRNYETQSWIQLKTMTKTIKQQNVVSVRYFYFEKIEIKKHLLCKIDFKSDKIRYTQNLCKRDHNHYGYNCNLFSLNEKHTPIAFVFYSDGPGPSDQ